MAAKRLAHIANRLTTRIQITRSAYSSWSAILGTALACVALCNLIFRVLRVSVFDALGWILAAYQQTFHPPIGFLFSWLPFALSPGAKDGLLLYMAMGGVLYRSLSYGQPTDLKRRFPKTWRSRATDLLMRVSHVVGAVVWPLALMGRLRKPCLLVQSELGSHGRLPPMQREKAKTFLAQMDGNPVVFCDERELIFSYFAALVVAVFAIVILNAAVNELSAKL